MPISWCNKDTRATPIWASLHLRLKARSFLFNKLLKWPSRHTCGHNTIYFVCFLLSVSLKSLINGIVRTNFNAKKEKKARRVDTGSVFIKNRLKRHLRELSMANYWSETLAFFFKVIIKQDFLRHLDKFVWETPKLWELIDGSEAKLYSFVFCHRLFVWLFLLKIIWKASLFSFFRLYRNTLESDSWIREHFRAWKIAAKTTGATHV